MKYTTENGRHSTRLQNWDYRWKGAYFVTICTKNREEYFGSITNKTMNLSAIGTIAQNLWFDLPNHFDNIQLDAFVVMPNHLHGIVTIVNDISEDDPVNNLVVGTLHATSLLSTKRVLLRVL